MDVNITEPETQETESQFCLKWSDHHGTLISVLENLFNDEMYVDCTLAADGQEISAHKVVLSACSPFLNRLLKKHYDKHPIILLKDVSFFELQCIIEYMYKGEVHINHDRLSLFLKAAETLQIAGLSGVYEKTKPYQEGDQETTPYQKEMDAVVEYHLNMDEESGNLSPVIKRQKTEVEEVEYLAQEETETEEVGEIKIKSELGSYQVYLVDNETGALKEMDVADEIPNEKITAEVIDEILNEETAETVQESGEQSANKQVQVNALPEKITTALTKTKIKPRAFIHRDDYNFSCTKCGGLYKHESSFLNHLRHDCNQVHTCESCRKRFKNKRHLLDHVRDDCGRVHVCPRCSKYFKQKVNLTTHMKHYCKPEKVHNIQTFVATQESM